MSFLFLFVDMLVMYNCLNFFILLYKFVLIAIILECFFIQQTTITNYYILLVKYCCTAPFKLNFLVQPTKERQIQVRKVLYRFFNFNYDLFNKSVENFRENLVNSIREELVILQII